MNTVLIIKDMQKQSSVFCRKGVLRNFAQFTGKHLCQSLFFNKVTGLTRNFLQSTSGGCFGIYAVSISDKVKFSMTASVSE